MSEADIKLKEDEISKMNSDKVEAFARILNMSTLKSSQKKQLQKAVDKRQDELKNNVSILAVSSDVKMDDGGGVEI